VPQL